MPRLPTRQIIRGIDRDFGHLARFVMTLPGKGKEGRDLRVAVRIGSHVVSRACRDAEADFRDETGRPRRFDEARYTASLALPERVRRAVAQNYFCWESKDRNRAMNYAIIDVPPRSVAQLSDGIHTVAYFYIRPARQDDADVELTVVSCYDRLVRFRRSDRRYNIAVVLRKCLYSGKRIP